MQISVSLFPLFFSEHIIPSVPSIIVGSDERNDCKTNHFARQLPLRTREVLGGLLFVKKYTVEHSCILTVCSDRYAVPVHDLPLPCGY